MIDEIEKIDSDIKLAFNKAERSFGWYHLQYRFLNDLVNDVEINYREVISKYKKKCKMYEAMIERRSEKKK